MLNLVQIQEKLKGMPLKVVMGYANGSNPQVPPYVALSELNRRKQDEISSAAQENVKDQPTIKDTTEQQLGLMALQKQRANQVQSGIAQQAAEQPTIPPQQMAEGGITRLPMSGDMFKKSNYAMGGIVAFQDNKDQPVNANMPATEEDKQFDQATALYEAEKRARDAERIVQDVSANQPDSSNKGLIAKLVADAAKAVTIEELAADQKKARELTGVSADPFAGSRQRRANLEEAYKKDEERQGLRELAAFLTGAGKAKGRRVSQVLNASSEEYQKMDAANRAINEKRQENLLALERADEKERDAIARGDAKALLDAKAEKDKLSYNIAKLSHDKESLAYSRFMAAVNGDPYLKQLEVRRKNEYVQPGSKKDLEYDSLMNARKQQLAKEAGYDYRVVPFENPVIPEKKPEKKGLFSGFGSNKKDEEKKDEAPAKSSKVDSGIPAGLPAGTTVFGRTPQGEVVYLTPDGKKVVQQ